MDQSQSSASNPHARRSPRPRSKCMAASALPPCRGSKDAAAFFHAVRSAFLAARHSVFVVGWDIDSRTRARATSLRRDGLPTEFGPFLSEFDDAQARAAASTCCFGTISLLYAHQREILPRLDARLADATAGQVLPGFHRLLRVLAASETGHRRRCAGLLRRPGPDHPALGHRAAPVSEPGRVDRAASLTSLSTTSR